MLTHCLTCGRELPPISVLFRGVNNKCPTRGCGRYWVHGGIGDELFFTYCVYFQMNGAKWMLEYVVREDWIGSRLFKWQPRREVEYPQPDGRVLYCTFAGDWKKVGDYPDTLMTKKHVRKLRAFL